MVLTIFTLTSRSSSADQFCNTTPILGPALFDGPANVYPSTINVSGLTGTITDVNVTLLDVRTAGTAFLVENAFDKLVPGYPVHRLTDADIMVSAPDKSNVILMSDAGGHDHRVVDADLTFDDQALSQLPADGSLASGTYRPVDYDDFERADVWDAPAPTPPRSTSLSTFNGKDPNGAWNLWLVDDSLEGGIIIGGGWCIDMVTTGGGGTTSTTSTTLPPTTSTTSTTLPPTTSTTTTTLPPTTSTTSTTLPPTTSTTTAPPDPCAQLRAARAAFNAQIDQAKMALDPSQFVRLEAIRAQGNAQYDAALARCTMPPSGSTTTTTSTSTTTTTSTSTTSTTLAPTTDRCRHLLAARAAFNAQIDQAKMALDPSQFVRLEAIRAQGNAQYDAALARCRSAT